jgi:hypothetical protein
MKARRRFVTCLFSMLVFFSCGAEIQINNASALKGAKPLALAAIPGDGMNRPKLARKPAAPNGWLEGTWEGTAYQSNTKENWTLRLTAKNNQYRIEYPSLSCGGEWKPISHTRKIATFREKLTHGQGDCLDNVTVTIRRLSDTQIIYWYVEPNQTRVMGIAVLDKQPNLRSRR